VLLVAVSCYANALHGPFVFDDRASIEENLTIRQLGDLSTALQPPAETPLGGRPLVNLTFAVNYALGGLQVEGYHLVNIALHVLTALTLFGVLRRTFARASFRGIAPATVDVVALVATLVWTAHPLNTESVNYVSQRTELMLGLFFLLALYSAIRGVDRPPARWLGLTAVCAVLAAASKESAVTLPIIIVLWDRSFVFDSLRAAFKQRWPVYAAAATTWVMFALLAGRVSSTRSLSQDAGASRWDYLLNQAGVIPQYLQRSLWPANLIFDYGSMSPRTIGDALPGLILLLALLAVTIVAVVRRPHIGFWAAWFWVTLAPASSLVPIVTEVGAERRMYLPLISVVTLLTMAGTALVLRLASGERRRLVGWAASGVLIVALSATTIARNIDYRSGLALWQTVIDRRPGPRAHQHRSMFLRDAGRNDEAIKELRLATAVDPGSGHALAAALLERGDLTDALHEFDRFVRTRPDDRNISLARREYATALRRAGHTNDAIAQLRAAVAGDPRDVRSYVELADMLSETGDTAGAMRVYQDAERVDPGNAVVLSNLGALLANAGAGAEAIPRLRSALAADPGLVAPRVLLVQQLLVAQDFATAEREARTLIAQAPANAIGYNLLGVALASQQRFDVARDAFARAVALDPNLTDARNNLTRIDSMSR
jgi:Flp pilus assembly protein TadD